jgi:hypothetical protein
MPKKVEWYRLNAERCQQLAQTFKDPEAKRTLAAMADSWLMLAARRVKKIAMRMNATPPHRDRGADARTPPALERGHHPMTSAATWQNAHTWRMRAEETRALAGELKGVEANAIMLRIADDYDRLAEWAEKNATNHFGVRRPASSS